MMIVETLIKESVSLIFAIVSNKIKNTNLKISSKSEEISISLLNHIQSVKNWSNEITFKDLKSSKQTTQIFIPLNLYVYPRRIRFDLEEDIKVIPLLEIFKKDKNHLAILGQPGAGKTTSMKYICQSIFFDDKFYPDLFQYPILIKLRELNQPIKGNDVAGVLYEYLFNLFGLKIESKDKEELNSSQLIRIKEILVLEIIEKLKVMLIIDGFDELVYKKHREIVRTEIGQIANFLETSRLVITSRVADYNYAHENISVYEICPLNSLQISDFACKWLGLQNSEKFLREVEKSPYNDTSIRPLTIAHLCAIYERIGKIPDKPKTVYRKIVNLLIEEWDEQRGVKRDSNYAMFETDRKFEFLSNLAYQLTTKRGKSIFAKTDLLNIYNDIYEDFDLDKNDALIVVNDIESHTGLFVQSGYDYYEFAHKSIQEYLTAEYIVKLPNVITNKRLIERIPNELAITVTISSNPSAYFVELVNIVFQQMNLSLDFLQKFINRLLLEKPDFYKNSQVGIASLVLYSNLINQSKEFEKQLKLFNSDFLVKEFEDFIDSIFKRNSREVILSIYQKKQSFDTIDNTTVSMLVKREYASSKLSHLAELNSLNRFPDILYCRDSFLG